MKRWISTFGLFAVLGLVFSAHAAGFIIITDPSWQPETPPHFVPPRPRPPHLFAPLEVASVKVDTRVNDQVAVTSVDQEFYNPNAARLEGTFVFPVPKGAHLDKFKMEIDGKMVEAELLGADKARHIYEDIVRRMRDPALLEYAGRDIFKVRIFPIEPNSRKRIHLSYTELLKSDNGLLTYNLPLNTEKYSAKPIKNVSVRVELESKRPLKSIYSPSHNVEVKRDGAHHATAGYEASDVQPDTDFALYFAPEKDEIGLNLLTSKRPGEDGYFLLLASPGVDVKEKELIHKDIVFVLDTSGSMAGKKLEQAKKALQFCIENLNDGDRFEVLRFSTDVEPVFDKLVEAEKQNRQKAEDFVKDLRPMGATAIDEALKRALKLQARGSGYSGKEDSETRRDRRASDRPFVIIFLTDGQPTIGVTSPNQILDNVKKENSGQTRIFCFGIGTDVNTHLLDKIAEETRGSSQYVLPEEDIELKVSNFFAKIKEPVLSNPTLHFTGDIRVSKMQPSALPDVFKGEQLLIAGRYSGHGNAAIIIEGTVNGEPRKFTYEAKFAEDSDENEFIPRLWATRRVGYLLDEIRLHGENNELRDETTELARKYGIVTPYTAYLIVEDETRREVPTTMRSLRGLQEDKDVRLEAEDAYRSFKLDTTGDAGIGGARASSALKSANAPSAANTEAGAAFQRRYGLSTTGIGGGGGASGPGMAPAPNGTTMIARVPTQSRAGRLLHYSNQSQFVGGKTFFLNDNAWVDGSIQKSSHLKHVRLQFGSKDYFDFVSSHPIARPWLALGQNVQFLLEGTVYEIYE